MAAPRDTSPEAWALLVERFRALRPDERVRLAIEMSDDVLAIARAGIRHRHPDWPSTRVEAALRATLNRPDGAEAIRAGRAG